RKNISQHFSTLKRLNIRIITNIILLSAKNDNLQTLGRKYIEKEKESKTFSGINNSSRAKQYICF
ncbi:hypothetical protein ACT4UT_04855, partial [Bacillus sp. B-TM1]